MKQTILSKCFGKMKRVVLTLFAALCVGSVWAEEGETTTPEATPESGSTPSTSALNIDERYGYVRTGLGELGDQAIVVFTNSAEGVVCTWTPPKNIRNIEFLAVGGGGGGGGHYKHGSDKSKYQGGAGGGGGAVVTGFIKDLSADQVVRVSVGAGGDRGYATTSATTGAGAGGNGGSSIIAVGDLTYITAYGGGGDGGYDSTGVAIGGSNSGARKNNTAKNLKTDVTVVGTGAEELVSDVVSRAHKGGGGYSTGSGYPAGGGGGAGGPGGVAGAGEGSSWGGSCGLGYVSMITDQRVVYGAGGGGGIGKTGGYFSWDWDEDLIEGAGRAFSDQPGEDALPNQGGGGGGGGYLCDGGAGGSGVVILRFGYSETDIPIDATVDILPKISDKVYTGEVLSSGLVETSAYKVEELEECVNVGAKVVRVTLNDGYAWTDGSTERYKDFPWNILKQNNNVWATTPFINVDSWGSAYTSNVIFHQADPLAGEVVATIVKDDGEPQQFNGDLPTEPGVYKLIYKVEETDNYSSLYWEKTFKIYQSETFAGGYKVYGLGDNEDEVAVVFTSTTDWTVPKNLKNVEFLVVGGGGGGGADTATGGQFQGGAGGGGGGVITGVIKELNANSAVTITVGDGGTGGDNGVNNSGYGAGNAGAESSIALGSIKIVTAKGGGRDAGATAAGNYTDGKVGGAGGSGGGGRPNKAGGAADAGSVDATYVLNSTKYANAGGAGCTVPNSGYGCGAAGGGGGATEVGGNGTKVDVYKGGDGGEGLASDITGALLVYGSGGGGSSTWDSAGVGGTGAGDGVYEGNGKSAIPNQGGGGGGGSRTCDGGNGGSGIVVFRYKVYAAEVNSTPYDTLSEAITAAADGATLTVLNDCTADTACVIANKTLTIDLNGKTVKANDTAAATDGNGVFWVQTGGVLTLEDSSEEKTGTVDGNGGNDYKMAIWADGGNVVINGGNYVNENDGPDNQYDLIYVKNGGEIVINGGTFKCQTPRWTLNSNNINKGTFVVTGGKFYQYNPTDFDTDEPTATTWCAENTAVIETTENEVKVYTVVPAAAKIGNVGYATFDAALEAAVSGDTVKLLVDVVAEKVVVVPTGATLDLNGKSIQALAVVGKLAMNGGVLKTYDTNTQTYFFMAAPAQTVGALYWTSDAVMTIGADYTLSLDGGSVTLPNSWRTLLKQKLTIKNGATFVIPQGVELNLRGNAVVEEGATLTCEGTIALGNTYDAIDTSATLTSAQLAEDKVISAVEGYKVQYAGGQYTLVQDGYIVTTEPESSAVTVTADTEAEALDQVKFNVTPPDGIDAAVYEKYFKLVATETAEASKTWIVALALKDELKPVIAETTADDTTKEAFVIDADGNVMLNISNKKPGLYYGVQVLKELGADPVAVVPETEAGALVVTADNIPDGNAAFFRVVVDFAPIIVPEAE